MRPQIRHVSSVQDVRVAADRERRRAGCRDLRERASLRGGRVEVEVARRRAVPDGPVACRVAALGRYHAGGDAEGVADLAVAGAVAGPNYGVEETGGFSERPGGESRA